MATFLDSLTSTTMLLAVAFALSVAVLILAIVLSLRWERRRMRSNANALRESWRQSQTRKLTVAEHSAVRERQRLEAANQAREREKYENGGC